MEQVQLQHLIAQLKMSVLVAFVGLLSGFLLPAHAQPCRQITIDSTQKSILAKYIHESVLGRYFVDDKGVVIVTRMIRSGRPAWQVRVALDDSYKDNPPIEWAQLDRDVILFYDAEQPGNREEKTVATPELLSCLDAAIGDRLYIRPPKKERWLAVAGPNGKLIKVQGKRIFGGNMHNDEIIIFEADGRINILKSL